MNELRILPVSFFFAFCFCVYGGLFPGDLSVAVVQGFLVRRIEEKLGCLELC